MSALEEPVDDAAPPFDQANGWKRDKRGREYVVAGRRAVYRRGDETREGALARDAARPRDERPRRAGAKTNRKPHAPAAPSETELRELEKALADGLMAPAVLCATFGDEWSANHFTNQGPMLARNLVVASDHNPWLRRKLETAASGGDEMLALVTLVGVGGALFAYAIPPVIWWFNLPVPDQARTMFGIPPRRQHQEPDATASYPEA